ncbi:hypothetical protein HDZ31DRAFT_30850 [Schizophyllum fasciatum]
MDFAVAESSSRSSSQRTDVLSNEDDDGIFDNSFNLSFEDASTYGEDMSFNASSPPSSPPLNIDSSPPSSPGLMEHILDGEGDERPPPPPPPNRRVVDPFAASGVNGVWKPRDYEKRDYPKAQKRTHVSSENDLEPKRQKLNLMPPPIETSRPIRPTRSTASRSLAVDPLQEAVDAAFETTNLIIDVSEKHLTELKPGPLEQLKSMVVIPQDQESAHSRSTSRTFSKSSSFGRTPSVNLAGTPSHTIRFMASKNAITKLPRELFELTRLTTLDLRSNRLTHIPAGIGALVNLETLSLYNNPIRYLPSEILKLNKLKQLLLFPNSTLQVESGKQCLVGEPYRFGHSRVPQLTELILRKLLAPHSATSASTQETYMEAHFVLPVTDYFRPDRPCPPHIRRVLVDCLPRSVGRSASSSVSSPPVQTRGPTSIFMSDFDTDHDVLADLNEVRAIDPDEQYEVLRCPNPAHGPSGTVFIHPLEVRFTWETHFGGATPGGAIPVRWRGCSWGCLDFLGEEEAETSDLDEEIHLVSGLGTGVGTFSDDEDA